MSVAGNAVRLTATEFELLRHLSTAGGRVLTHEQSAEVGLEPGAERGRT